MRIILALVLLAGCSKSSDKKPTEAPPQTGSSASGSGSAAEPKKAAFATPEQKLQRYLDCVAAFNTSKQDVLGSCYGESSVREQVDSVPELVANGSKDIVEMVTAQRASFPDLSVTPRIVIVSGDTIASILHVSGTNSAAAGGMKATNKKLGIFEAEIAKIADDGTITKDSFYVDQPTIYHQLGLLPNDSSPGALAAPTGDPEVLISKNDERETANKALVQKLLGGITAKDATVIEAAAADDIEFTYHGEKQKVEGKKAYMKWMKDVLNSTDEGVVEVTGIWAAGDAVIVSDVFTGTPKDAADDRRIRTNVVQFFRISDGKIKQQQMFANRLNTAVQLGLVDPDELMAKLAAAVK